MRWTRFVSAELWPAACWRRNGFAGVIRGARCGHDPVPKKQDDMRRAACGIKFSWIKQESSLFRFASCCSAFWFYEQTKIARRRSRRSCRRQREAAPDRSPRRRANAGIHHAQGDDQGGGVRLAVQRERTGTNARAHERPNARYTFTSRGGGLKQIELLDYPETISARWIKRNP